MGGCCSSSSKGAEVHSTPATYYYYPRAGEGLPIVASHHAATSALCTGLLVDTNLDTSTPDTYRPPPTPLPYDVVLGYPQTPLNNIQEVDKSGAGVQTTNSDSIQETVCGITQEALAKCEDVKETNNKLQTDVELGYVKDCELEISKSVDPTVSGVVEEDSCPTCLDEYDPENPKIMTQCEHHFHLSCILEWLERSDTCPVCDQEMIFSLPVPID